MFSGSSVSIVAQTLILCLIITLLSAPVIICNDLSGSAPRTVVIMIFLTICLTLLSALTSARTIELFIAGAT